MRFKTLIATILALSIGLPALARGGAPVGQAVSQTPPVSHSTAAAPKTDMVDINSATVKQLKALPGVTDSDAAKIISRLLPARDR